MKVLKINAVISLALLFASCQSPNNKVVSKPVIASDEEVSADSRPKDQIQFLLKVKNNMSYNMPSSAILKDEAVTGFNKYAADSLTSIRNWEFTVTSVNDDSFDVNSVWTILGIGDQPIYNLDLVAPAIIDKSVDTISVSDRVDFTYTTLKKPKSENQKKILATLKTLSNGDVVLVSGAVTHVNEKGKIDFSTFFVDPLQGWKLDVLITDIRKKP